MELKNPEIDVEEVMRRIREEVRRGKGPDFLIQTLPSSNVNVALPSGHIEALISIAQEKSRVRAKFPKPFLRFPFKYSKKLQRYALKAIELLFYDQHEFNLALLG